MNYKVIARKYRPLTFEEVIGQKHVTQTLQNAIRDGRIAHAFLFTGERGVGKTSIARILAKALNCKDGPSVEPCGACASCVEITGGNCLDVNEIDGASNTGVDDIRMLRENIKYLPSRDRYKIYIIDEVHMLSTSAFNALLKTLEEPPQHVIFMFATTEPRKIPDTIISRCLRFDFKRIPTKEIVEHLEHIARDENVHISTRGLFLIARDSEGSMRDAQTILERAVSYCGGEVKDHDIEELLGHIDRRHIYRIMESVLAEDPEGCIHGLNEVYDYGVDIKQFYYSFLEHLRDLMMIKILNDSSKLVDLADEDLKKLKELSDHVSFDELQRCFRLWFSSEAEIAKSVFPKIGLEVCLLEMVYLKKAIPVDDILCKIDWLKKKLEDSNALSIKKIPTFRPGEKSENTFKLEKKTETLSEGVLGGEKDTEAFLAFARKTNPPLASVLSYGNIEIRNDNVFKVEFPAGSFFINKIKDVETEKKLSDMCKKFFQKEMSLLIVATNGKKTQDDREEMEKINKKKQDKAFSNPVIHTILKTFDGKIVNINNTDM